MSALLYRQYQMPFYNFYNALALLKYKEDLKTKEDHDRNKMNEHLIVILKFLVFIPNLRKGISKGTKFSSMYNSKFEICLQIAEI